MSIRVGLTAAGLVQKHRLAASLPHALSRYLLPRRLTDRVQTHSGINNIFIAALPEEPERGNMVSGSSIGNRDLSMCGPNDACNQNELAPPAAEKTPDQIDYINEYSRLRRVVDQIPDMIYVKDLEGRFLFANDAIVSNNGLYCLEDLLGRTDFEFLSAEVAQLTTGVERLVAETGQPHSGDEELAFRGDDERWLMISRAPFRDEAGDVVGVIGVSRDVTTQKFAARLKDTQSRLLEMIAQGLPLRSFFEEFAKMIGSFAGNLHATFLLAISDHIELIAPTLGQEYRTEAGRRVACHELPRLECAAVELAAAFSQTTISAGEYECHCYPIATNDRIEGILALHSPHGEKPRADLSEFFSAALRMAGIAIERHRSEARIGFLADHDPLTGMANRTLLDRRLEAAVRRVDAEGGDVTLAFIDLDNFKLVNDSLGHSAGDQLLKTIASRVCDLCGGHGSLARIGGDEFVLVFERVDANECLQRLSTIRKAVARPVLLGGIDCHVTCSIGVASYPSHARTVTDLLAAADMAMYRAKEAGRDGLVLFNADMAACVRKKLSRTDELRRAISRNEFVLHYQPQVDARTGIVVGAEALVRWNHPTEGLLYPGEFIALAEDTGQIVSIGDWVIQEACAQAKRWQEMGFDPIRMSVNVSARQFQGDGLVETVTKAIEESGLDPEWLELEITESLVMKDPSGSIAKMHDLTAVGVTLAVDDFGTGYSSLSALKKFPVSRLKIDRSFIADLPHDEEDMAIASAIISLADKLGLEVIAEGVETLDQAQFLIENGCQHIQGYLYSRPVPQGLFAPLLKKSECLGSSCLVSSGLHIA